MNSHLSSVADEELKALAIKANFRPAEFAVLIGYSPRTIERHFAERFRQTPRDWLRKLRLELAKELLKQSYTTKAIAAELQFPSVSTLCGQFKKADGVSPQEFALRHRINKTVGQASCLPNAHPSASKASTVPPASPPPLQEKLLISRVLTRGLPENSRANQL